MVRISSRASSRARRRRRGKGDGRAALELVLSAGNHALAVTEPRRDHGEVLRARADLDGTRLGRVVLGNDPSEQALRSALDGSGRDDEGIAAGVDQYPCIDEIPGPKPFILVREHRLEPDGRGRLIDDVVDKQELSGAQGAAVILVVGNDLDWSPRHGIAHIVESARGEREQY